MGSSTIHTFHYLFHFVQIPVKAEHFGAIIVNVSAPLITVIEFKIAPMAAMRLDVTALQLAVLQPAVLQPAVLQPAVLQPAVLQPAILLAVQPAAQLAVLVVSMLIELKSTWN